MFDHGKETEDFVEANEPGYKQGGLRIKYKIQKANGRPVDPNAIYFVLRLDKDPHAREAAKRYAESVKEDNEELSRDLMQQLEICKTEAGE